MTFGPVFHRRWRPTLESDRSGEGAASTTRAPRVEEGSTMKTLIVCVSVSHGNTKKIAETIGDELGATVLDPEAVDVASLGDYDLVGFGSGIFSMRFHPRLCDFIRTLPTEPRGKAFLFWTSGARAMPFWSYKTPMVRLLESKGFDVVGTFSCRGFDTWLPLQIVGGFNKGRPNEADLAAARSFGASLRPRGRARSARPRSSRNAAGS
jgi:flavodoxin